MDVNATVALRGCRMDRVLDGSVEIVDARPAERSFPDRVTETLGVCLKFGPDHDVKADGRTMRYPRDTICVRLPGYVWSASTTGRVGFLSIDIDASYVPEDGPRRTMHFFEPDIVPNLPHCARVLRSSASVLAKEEALISLVEVVAESVSVKCTRNGSPSPRSVTDQAREMLESNASVPPNLRELAAAIGVN